MTFVSALSQIPSEKQIRKQLALVVFGRRVACPRCGLKAGVAAVDRARKWRCRRCRKPFSLTSATWLSGMKISTRHLWALAWCWQRKVAVQQARELLGLSVPTVRRWYALFRDNLDPGPGPILEGRVQMDEMFVRGGFVIGAKDVARKRVCLEVVAGRHPTKTDAMAFIRERVRRGSTLCTDGGSIYNGCGKLWPVKHERDIHKRFEFAVTSEIEGTWGVLRTFMRRMYHHVTFAKLPKVVAEFEARYSRPELFVSPLAFFKNSLPPVSFAF